MQPPSLYRSLSKTFLLNSVLPLLLLAFIVLYSLAVNFSNEIREKNQVLARAISGQVKAELSAPLATLNNLRYLLNDNQGFLARTTLRNLLNQHLSGEDYFDSIYLLSAEGLIQVVGLPPARDSQRDDFIGMNLAHLTFYQKALASEQVTWSDSFHSLITSNTSLAICVPLEDGRAIIGNIRIDFLQTLLGRISSGQRVEVSILDHRGEIIAVSDPHRGGRSANLLHLHLVQQGLNGVAESALFTDKGISHLGSVANIDGPGWLTLVSQPTNLAYEAVTHAGILFGLGLITAVVLTLLLAIYKARRMAEPFHQLSRHAESIASGGYTLPRLAAPYLEVASLEESFNNMAEAIRLREAAMARSERDYRTLAENLPALVYRIDLQEENRLTLIGSYQEKMTGFTVGEVLAGGTGLYASRIHPEDFAATRNQVSDAIKRQQPYNVGYRFLHKDGGYRHFIERGTPIFDAQQTPLYLDGVVFDNSEQHHARELLLQTEKMKSVGGLAAGMAHEINNPLAGILLNMQMIRQRLNPERPANHQRAQESGVPLEKILEFLHASRVDGMLGAIDEAAGRTAKIVENVLSFSRKGKGVFKECQLIELIQQTLQLAEHNFDLKKGFDFKNIRVEQDFAEDLPPLYCEPVQIQQVLLNVLKNAAQAMFEQTAEFREPTIRISAQRKGNQMLLQVSDNGPGMSDQVQRRIFEPFFTTKEAGQGTGLGLSVSYFIINKTHQGSMSVDSSPGHGSRFSILLPFQHSNSSIDRISC